MAARVEQTNGGTGVGLNESYMVDPPEGQGSSSTGNTNEAAKGRFSQEIDPGSSSSQGGGGVDYGREYDRGGSCCQKVTDCFRAYFFSTKKTKTHTN